MTATPPPDKTGMPDSPAGPEQNAPPHSRPVAAPVPFYRRSWFWILMGILVGIALLLALFRCQPADPAAGTPPASSRQNPDAEMADLLALQRAQNEGLEAEVRRLQALMKEDPCALPGILGESPEVAPLAPGYGGATPDPKTAGPFANGTAPPPAPGGNATTSGVTPLAAPATVGELMDQATVFILSRHGDQISMGSGFFVAPGIIATNGHVVQNREAEVLAGNKRLGGMQRVRILAFSQDDSRDYALLRVDDSLAGKVPVLRIANGTSRMDRVSAWGFPGYIAEIDPKLAALAKGDSSAVPEVVYSEGVVSVVLDRTPPAILHTASISQGNSGGPLVNAQGVVVGINTFIKKADKSYTQTNIALPGEDLARFMKENGIQASLATR